MQTIKVDNTRHCQRSVQVFALWKGRHILPLYTVLQFLLDQPNSLKHISDIIDSPFLYLKVIPTSELFIVSRNLFTSSGQ